MFPFFTPSDGNYIKANEFLDAYAEKFGKKPNSIWPPMQAFDAANLLISKLRSVNKGLPEGLSIGEWLRSQLHEVSYFEGVCGNLLISEDGMSKGVYFSLYRFDGEGDISNVTH